MKIRWLGQSGYILKTENSEIIIDPYLSDIVNRVAHRPRMLPVPIKPSEILCDAVICTHNHLDHLDPDTVKDIAQNQLFITTVDGKETLENMGKTNIRAIKSGDIVRIGDFTVTAVDAFHTVEAFGVVIKADNTVLYFSGDTLFNEKLFEIAKFRPDITFICINGKLGNMNVKEAVLTAEKIGAKINIPNHYGMFESNTEDPRKFTDSIEGGKILEFNTEYDTADF